MAANFVIPRVAALFLAIALAACSAPAPQVYIVRHAEKLAGDDPPLSPPGVERAHALAGALSGAGITRIFSTDTRRTRATAAPLAHALGITPEIYSASAADALAAEIAASRQTVLIVGHSNTIAQMAAAFGVDPGTPVDEATEYDRLYVITLNDAPRVEIRRYGR